MSWSKTGALALLKIKETILNNEWDIWWETERERNIKVGKYKPPLPALSGPDQDKPGVGVLRKLSQGGYY